MLTPGIVTEIAIVFQQTYDVDRSLSAVSSSQGGFVSTIYGLKWIDVCVIVGYFLLVMLIGFWASRKVKDDEDFFLGGRSFGKGLLMMHWLCTGTHSEMAVQVAGATARVGLGGIWYQWMWLFSTPFYWIIAPVIRRLRVVTTGDFFRIRYGRDLEMAYAVIALLYIMLSIALLLRGAGAAIAGATGGAVPTEWSVILLSVLFSTYVVAGGLMAAAYTDYLQGVMIIVLSCLLVPVGLSAIGGVSALHHSLDAGMLSITAPPGSREGNLGFVIAMSLLGLTGVVVQPHVMNATGSGKTELESRVGMCYGNFIKRLLTVAWAFTGLIAVVMFPEVLQGLEGEEAAAASETLFGLAIRNLLGDGWRGLMIACIVAGVTSAETFMVVGAGVFTRNFYRRLAPQRSNEHYLTISRVIAVVILTLSIGLAFVAESVTQLVFDSIEVIGLLGAAFWLGIVWRRVNRAAVWSSLIISLAVWLVTKYESLSWLAEWLWLSGHDRSVTIIIGLGVQFGVLIVVSLLTRPESDEQLNAFYARLHTPVGSENEFAAEASQGLSDEATLGLRGRALDYEKARQYAYAFPRRFGFEITRWNLVDWAGFLVAWIVVGALIALLAWLAQLGS
jgi:Na+/proline symporter